MTNDTKAQILDNLEAQLSGDTIPEKFRGKSVKDVFKSYSELESAYSRQGQELGDARRLASSLAELEVQTSKNTVQARQPVSTDDLLTDPDKAINEAIETHPAVKQARETADQLERQLALNKFEKSHPNFRETASDNKFQEWVNSTPGLKRLARDADGYDMDAADTLFSLWKEKVEMQAEIERKAADRENKRKQEQEGTLEGASGTDASSETIYSRAEFRELQRRALLGDRSAMAKWNDPKFQELRRKAYMDKRVS